MVADNDMKVLMELFHSLVCHGNKEPIGHYYMYMSYHCSINVSDKLSVLLYFMQFPNFLK